MPSLASLFETRNHIFDVVFFVLFFFNMVSLFDVKASYL